MKLLKGRIRGLGATIESQWFDLSPGLNCFHFPDDNTACHFLRAVETLNPIYRCLTVRPFSHFPETIRQGQRTRRVIPAKRTVSIGVFDSTPSLVNELATITPLLYETDRIEVGRRMDYSRWVNFVELSSSTRWSEIAGDMETLRSLVKQHDPHHAAALYALTGQILPSDRVKNELGDNLLDWLKVLPQIVPHEAQQIVATVTEAVLRAEYFHAAKTIVKERLPLFVIIGDRTAERALQQRLNNLTTPDSDNPIDTSDTSPLKHLESMIRLAISFSQTVFRTPPILLFNSPDRLFPSHDRFVTFITELSDTVQCLCTFTSQNTFSPDNGVKTHRYKDLIGCP